MKVTQAHVPAVEAAQAYSFDYKLEEDTLEINFEKQNLRDSTFKVSVVDGVMNLQCLDEYFENEYELHKAED